MSAERWLVDNEYECGCTVGFDLVTGAFADRCERHLTAQAIPGTFGTEGGRSYLRNLLALNPSETVLEAVVAALREELEHEL